MKHLFSTCALALALLVAADTHAAAYIKIEGVDGETKTSASAPARAEVQPIRAEQVEPSSGPGNTTYPVIKYDVPVSNTVPGVEPDEIDYNQENENATNFGILLGGGLDQDDDGDSVPAKDEDVGLARALEVLEDNAKASDQAIESVSLNFEKITTKIKQEVKILGFIPTTVMVTVDVDALANAEVHYPWWAFLASGKDSDLIGARVVSTLSNVLKTKHDTIKNAIGNIR